MVFSRYWLALVGTALVAVGACAADPVVVELQTEARVQSSLVTIGDVARVSGGDALLREQVTRLDLADVKAREQTLAITRRVIDYRLRLANIDLGQVAFTGADRTTVTVFRRTVTAEEVVSVARSEVLRWLTVPRESVTVELARPVVVRLPDVPAADPVSITAIPHVKAVGVGRIQMDMAIASSGEKLLALSVELDIKPIARGVEQAGAFTPAPLAPAAAITPLPPAMTVPAVGKTAINPNTVLIHTRERVTMVVRMGGLNVTAVGEAQQEGRLGQVIPVQNADSKKTVNARVTGPGTVEIELEPRPQ